MSAGRYDIVIEQGTDFSRVITWKDEDGNAINLTGFTAVLQARKKVTDENPVINLSNGSGITLGGAAGTITITISDTATAAYNFSSLIYNLELTGAGITTRVLQGIITLSREVAR